MENHGPDKKKTFLTTGSEAHSGTTSELLSFIKFVASYGGVRCLLHLRKQKYSCRKTQKKCLKCNEESPQLSEHILTIS